MMIQNILSETYLMIGAGVVAGVGSLILLIRSIKKKSAKKELKQLADDKKREELLNGVLLNSYEKKQMVQSSSAPYEVDYTQSAQVDGEEKETAGAVRAVQLIEHNELSVRKHVINLQHVIRIGSKLSGNSIIVSGVGEHQCEIFAYEGGAYIRDIGGGGVTRIQRKKKQVYAEEKGIRLCDGDKIILNQIVFDVALIK